MSQYSHLISFSTSTLDKIVKSMILK